MLIYMDLCCFNRPFDDQTRKTIFLEAEAKLFIQDMINQDAIALVWSYMLEYENSANPDIDVRVLIARWRSVAKYVIKEDAMIIAAARNFRQLGFGIKDAIHVACAIGARADYFITTDRSIIAKRGQVAEVMIVNPMEFISLKETQT